MVPDLAAALQPRGRLRRVGVRAARLEGVGSAGGPARRHHHGRAPPGARAPPEPEGELASEVGDDRRQWPESRGSRKEPRTCPHARPYGTVGGGGHRRKFVSRFGPTSPSLTPIAAIQWSATMPSWMIVRALGLATLALFFLGAFTPLPVFLYAMISVPVHIERADATVVLAGR